MRDIILNEESIKLLKEMCVASFNADTTIKLEFVLDSPDKAVFLEKLEATQCKAVRENIYCSKMNSFNCAKCKNESLYSDKITDYSK